MVSLKVHGSKVMMISTFHGMNRPSLWRWRAPADSSRKIDCTPRQRKRTSKLLLSKNLLALIKAKKRSASRDVHASLRNTSLVTNFILAIMPSAFRRHRDLLSLVDNNNSSAFL